MNEKYALGVDIGGSHIACQVVELGSSRPVGETYTEVKIAENEAAQKILAAWDSALGACMQKAGARAITEEAVRAQEERVNPMEELAKQFKEARSLLDEMDAPKKASEDPAN